MDFKSYRMFLLLLAQSGFENSLVTEFGRRAMRKSATTVKNNAQVFPKTAFPCIKLRIGQILKATRLQPNSMGQLRAATLQITWLLLERKARASERRLANLDPGLLYLDNH